MYRLYNTKYYSSFTIVRVSISTAWCTREFDYFENFINIVKIIYLKKNTMHKRKRIISNDSNINLYIYIV